MHVPEDYDKDTRITRARIRGNEITWFAWFIARIRFALFFFFLFYRASGSPLGKVIFSNLSLQKKRNYCYKRYLFSEVDAL